MLKPLDDRLLVKPVKTEVKTDGGLYLPDMMISDTNQAIVVSVGHDEDLQEMFSEGDRIMYVLTSGEPVRYLGEDYLILERMAVLAIIIETED